MAIQRHSYVTVPWTSLQNEQKLSSMITYIQPIQNGRILPARATLAVLAREVPLAVLLEPDVPTVEVVEITAVPLVPVDVLLAPPTPVPVEGTAVLVVFNEEAEVDVGAVQLAVKKT